MSVQAQLKGCMGLPLTPPECGGDLHPWLETWRRALVVLPGISLHPEPQQPHSQPTGKGVHGQGGATGDCDPETEGSMDERTHG